MPYADSQGVRIHYEVEGAGPPITLMHGMGGSIDNWVRAGYVDALKGELRLILIDSRGFGESGKPPEPAAYTREAKVGDVVAVLDDLGIERAHYWGYSMGASNGWAMGMLRPDRLLSLVLGGYPALPRPTSERNRVKWESRAKLMRLGMDVYIAAIEMERGPMPEEQRARLLANDKDAYAAQQIANIDWGSLDEDVRAMTVPAFVYSGTNDDYPLAGNHAMAKHSASLAPDATFLALPGFDHGQAFQESATVISHVREFLAKVSAGVGA
jgi:pimeloyl-ACP methyl ester carboxylesterase